MTFNKIMVNRIFLWSFLTMKRLFPSHPWAVLPMEPAFKITEVGYPSPMLAYTPPPPLEEAAV